MISVTIKELLASGKVYSPYIPLQITQITSLRPSLHKKGTDNMTKYFYVGMTKGITNLPRFHSYSFDNTAASFLMFMKSHHDEHGYSEAALVDIYKAMSGSAKNPDTSMHEWVYTSPFGSKPFKMFCDLLSQNPGAPSGITISKTLRSWYDTYLYHRMENMRGINSMVKDYAEIDKCLVTRLRAKWNVCDFSNSYTLDRGFIVAVYGIDIDEILGVDGMLGPSMGSKFGGIMPRRSEKEDPNLSKLTDDTFNSFMTYRHWFLNSVIRFDFEEDTYVDGLVREENDMVTVTVPMTRCIDITDVAPFIEGDLGIHIFNASKFDVKLDSKEFRLTP